MSSSIGTTKTGAQYRRGRIPVSGLTGVIRRDALMMERGTWRDHTQEEIIDFMDESERLFKNPDNFVTHIPAVERPDVPVIQHDIEIPSLRRVQPRLVPILRQHSHFRYLLRGVPSCAHKTEDELIQSMRINAGVELDVDQHAVKRENGDPWRFLFVRADEKTEPSDTNNERPLPSDPANAPYQAPELTANLPVEEFLLDTTSPEDKNSILEDIGVVLLIVEPVSFRVLDWWIEFG